MNTQITETRDTYSTTDIDFASVLLAMGFELKDVGIKKEDKRRRDLTVFTYRKVADDGRSISDVSLMYSNKTLVCNARELFEACRHLRNRAHNRED